VKCSSQSNNNGAYGVIPLIKRKREQKREQNKQMVPLAAVDGSGSDKSSSSSNSEQVYLKMQLNKVKPL